MWRCGWSASWRSWWKLSKLVLWIGRHIHELNVELSGWFYVWGVLFLFLYYFAKSQKICKFGEKRFSQNKKKTIKKTCDARWKWFVEETIWYCAILLTKYLCDTFARVFTKYSNLELATEHFPLTWREKKKCLTSEIILSNFNIKRKLQRSMIYEKMYYPREMVS